MNRSHNIFSSFYTKTHHTGTKRVLFSREQHLHTKQMTHQALIFVSSHSVNNRLHKLRAVSTCPNVPLSCQHYSEPLNIVAHFCCIHLHVSEAFESLTGIGVVSQPPHNKLSTFGDILSFRVVVDVNYTDKTCNPAADIDLKHDKVNFACMAELSLTQYFICNSLVFSEVQSQKLTPNKFHCCYYCRACKDDMSNRGLLTCGF